MSEKKDNTSLQGPKDTQVQKESDQLSASEQALSYVKFTGEAISSQLENLNNKFSSQRESLTKYAIQGKDQAANQLNLALQNYQAARVQVWATVDPALKTFNKSIEEAQKFKNDYQNQVLRRDNHEKRKMMVLYSTLGVSALSMVFLKKGYFRHTIRNTGIYFLASSYLLCPENFNPF